MDYGVSRALNYHRLKQLLLTSTLHEFFSQNHLFLEGQNRPIPAPQNQALARADSAGVLERGWRARQAVPTPMPSSREMTFHEAPEARRLATWRATATGGSPAPSAFSGINPLKISKAVLDECVGLP